VLGRDGIAGLVCLAGSLWLLALTRGLPQPALVPVGPAFYPRIVLVVTAVLAAILLGNDVLSRRRRPPPARAGTRANETAPRNYRLVALTFAIFAAYVLLLPVLGYRVATFLFVLVLQLVLQPAGTRHWVRVLVVALGTAVVTHFVFESYLSVLLPRGRWTGM
jgi:putative tricarboxylic transport membrane protein